ncbi:MAG: 4-hydroxy-tetrahydrodipicolinate reductase [Gemmatimonadales bacterium]
MTQVPGQPLRVCIAGATGWAGRALVPAVLQAADLRLSGAVARRAAGQDVAVALGLPAAGVEVSPTVEGALENQTDVLVDYTGPLAVKRHTLLALERGTAVVIGTSGLTGDDYREIAAAAERHALGVIAAGNFSISAALATYFATLAGRLIPNWEIIDYAHGDKIDVPSGTARELAERLGRTRGERLVRPIAELVGPPEARGADVQGTRVHSIRLPGHVIALEALFGAPDERLTIRYEAGPGAGPYLSGTLMAVRQVVRLRVLVRGLDRLLQLQGVLPASMDSATGESSLARGQC